MEKTNVTKLVQPGEFADPLTDIVRNGARELLARAVETEVEQFLADHAHLQTDDGRKRLVRHGYLPERKIQTGIGAVTVSKPRVRDRVDAGADKIKFTSAILPAYLRRSKSLDELIPALYLRGISTGDFQEVLSALLGPDAPSLSPETIRRLKAGWQEEWKTWVSRDLSTKRYVYIWADGIYLNARKALHEVYDETCHQRCWVHKTANVLNKLPKALQCKAKSDLQQIWMAEGRDDADKAFDLFLEKYSAKYDKAADCLQKDREALLAFFDFPAEHWKHIRTTNPIESTFATVRHRTIKTKGALSRETALSMVFKLVMAAQKKWLRLNGRNELPKLIQGVRFSDGIEVKNEAQQLCPAALRLDDYAAAGDHASPKPRSPLSRHPLSDCQHTSAALPTNKNVASG